MPSLGCVSARPCLANASAQGGRTWLGPPYGDLRDPLTLKRSVPCESIVQEGTSSEGGGSEDDMLGKTSLS